MKNRKINSSLKRKIKKQSSSYSIISQKVKKYQEIIQNTILYIQKYKTLDIIDAGDLNICIQNMENLYESCKNVLLLIKDKKNVDINDVANRLQIINNELSINFKSYGTANIKDLLDICIGNDYINKYFIGSPKEGLFKIIEKYIHPISYKIMDWKEKNSFENKKINQKLAKNRIVEDFMLVETADSLDCFDLARTTKNFQTKVYGIKVCFQNPDKRKTLIVSAIVDEMVIDCLNDDFIENKISLFLKEKPKDDIFQNEDFLRFTKSLTLKLLLVYSNKELYQKYTGYISQINRLKKKTISQVVKEFISDDLFGQRKTLIQLLMKYNDLELQYLAYLLYDLLSSENNGNFDTLDQTVLFDSLPWSIKKYFRDAMTNTVKYTKNLTNFDTSKIPIEQQICLMKANDSIKEKAMLKLKEVKAKSEDSGSKARQYLEGLLKIPFGIYKKEHILSVMDNNNNNFIEIVKELKEKNTDINIPEKDKYSTLEIEKHCNYLQNTYVKSLKDKYIQELIKTYSTGKRDNLISNICFINSIVKKHNKKQYKILHSGKKIDYMKKHIKKTLENLMENNEKEIIVELVSKTKLKNQQDGHCKLVKSIENIRKEWISVNQNMTEIKNVLDDSVYGHFKAKRQIERVIGQWITGEQSGYCFGFEGPPGVGKTSLARKGLANCLKDKDGTTRPFSFIALGGSSNGSTLSGHNYTYVGSTWGRIVDILMEQKCMNPIIFIDELDKVSRTENGKEIIGILTHLIDPTQNEGFQDKYFNGIDIDMSKALFIFSYNDVGAIDKILLDRIHRIKFDHLTLFDKIEITNKYILPELYEKIGLTDIIQLEDNLIKFIIENYTNESGVRKLKEILFEVISEINLEILNHENGEKNIPIIVTKDEIKNKYLKERHEMIHKKIHQKASVGVMNGLWANALGMGGIIPIECFYLPSNNFLDFKLTGLQGDVMKESMNVAKTLAWKLTTKAKKTKLVKDFEKTKLQGIHIHCPEGAVPKDGPSAGTAITTAIYSLLNNKVIKKDVAITGEINLQGRVTAIGGLELKILGGMRAGVKTFIFPEENLKDHKKFMEKYEPKNIIPNDIKFISVNNIQQVLKIVFE
tara:strand:- start:1869 stop:5156 length:3288 start_codon:yes stop_codon:yes gene_type:complete